MFNENGITNKGIAILWLIVSSPFILILNKWLFEAYNEKEYDKDTLIVGLVIIWGYWFYLFIRTMLEVMAFRNVTNKVGRWLDK